MSDIKKCKCDGHWHKDAMVENNDTYLCVVCASKEITRLQAENDRLRQAMEWISVEDRLPERSSEDVITCIHYGNRHFAYEYENYYLPDTNEWANPLHKWTHWTKAILPPEVD